MNNINKNLLLKLSMKKILFLSLIIATVITMCILFSTSLFAATTVTSNQTGTHEGFFYSFWNQGGGSVTMTLNTGGNYSVNWSNCTNFVCGKGWNPGAMRNVTYSGSFNGGSNGYLALYGWTKNQLIEYYVVENYGSWTPPGASSSGTLNSDGGTYNLHKTTRTNQPSIVGTATFDQFWSVRTAKRSSGTITFSNHANAWSSKGWQLGSTWDYQIMCTEGYQSSGSSNITVSSGGSSTTTNTTTTSVPTTSSSNNSSISIAAGSSSSVGDFKADQYYSGGTTYNNNHTVSTSGITNPPPASLFNNERYGAMTYTIPGLTSGNSYDVTLYFAETFITSSGNRLFNVSINSSPVLSNFDIYATAGGQDKAVAKTFTTTANSNGQIVIQFTSVTENPKINGIRIKPSSSSTSTSISPSTTTSSITPSISTSPTPTTIIPTSTVTPVTNLPSYDSLPSNSKLPDPFKFMNGTRMTSKSQWAQRRAEISALAQKFEFGTKPPTPSSVTGSYSSNRITVNVSEGGKSASFSCSITYPSSGKAPYPAIIGVGGSSLNNSLLSQLGVAVINLPNDDIANQTNSGSRGKGKFYDIYGSNHSAGALIAWAWGADCLIDALEKTPSANIDPQRLGVTGCSRNGKGALAVGAFCERIVLTIPQESGSGGAASWRVSDAQKSSGQNVQTLSQIVTENCWFTSSFSQFSSTANKLPFDHHSIEGLVAPRALLVIENTSMEWLGNLSTWTTGNVAHMIWEALGVPDKMGFSQVSHSDHCGFPSSQQAELTAFVQKFLVGNGSGNTNIMKTDGNLTFDKSKWVDWTVPSLQ